MTSPKLFRVVATCAGLAAQLAFAQSTVEPVPVEPVPIQAPAPATSDPARSPTEPSGLSLGSRDSVGGIEQSGPVPSHAVISPTTATVPMPPSPLELLGSKQVRIVVGSPAFAMHMGSHASQRVVEGSPYCAHAESESIAGLPDGKLGAAQTVQAVVTLLCRDAQGRTRQELSRGGKPVVFIHDPVQKTGWVLDVATKTATRSSGSSAVSASGHQVSPAGIASAAQDARLGVDLARTAHELARWARDLTHQTRVDLVEAGASQTGWRVSRPAGSATMAGFEWSGLPRGEGVSKSLGQREIDGIRANGELTTWVIESSKEPIRITREVWTSPDLMLTVLSRDVDPRRGEHNYRLKNVNRNNPSPELFRVPADYAERSPSAK